MYGADSRRLYQSKLLNAGTGATQEVVTFWSGGKRAGRFELAWSGTTSFVFKTMETNVYFGGKPLRLGAETNVVADRLGSVRRTAKDYFPYGQENPTTTAGEKEKYATYMHDGRTDLAYADQRYYATGAGRFMTADPAGDGLNWYSYVGGDPVNGSDPRGLVASNCAEIRAEVEAGGGTVSGCVDRYVEPARPRPPPLGICEVFPTHPSCRPRIPVIGGRPWDEEEKPPVLDGEAYGTLAQAYAEAVRRGTYTDCEAMAYYVTAALTWGGSQFTALESLNVFYPSSVGGRYNPPVTLQAPGRPSGYRPEYRDYEVPRDDQGHHFAFFFVFGASVSTLDRAEAAVSIAVASLGMELNNLTPLNGGDIRLGIWAGNLGYSLTRTLNEGGTLNPGVVGNQILSLCEPR